VNASAVYLDSSAFVKSSFPSPESVALARDLSGRAAAVSAETLELEALRAAARVAGTAVARARFGLAAVALVPLSAAIRASAAKLEPPDLRSLDPIHLATALAPRRRREALLTYHKRLVAAATAAGLRVEAPA